ncbi:SGNH/GDSL hydrolase family protein [Sansalvadorimonas sp. 2012CJ34-2]|uniref:SGNH/GDSL hydrolase family protein n=1 Tax=Parendozoicomonas callyspongiae TaxID=2942213 RepID=A0ABT0PFJ4_9GAMM|nr:SGNH/GDSL hydrolase family protein [Sansalvadorimonas sp. 2012CJ34-2]MCL6270149.1 SGNH/GDSL hydrolase family protein [Sansalvadorimonas sp. 2012CJ34-2]
MKQLFRLIQLTVLTIWLFIISIVGASADQEIKRLVVFGDSLSDDGGNNSTWFLLKTLNGLTGESGIKHMQPWMRGWLAERITNYNWFCENTSINCPKHEIRALKALIAVTEKSGAIPIAPRDHYYQGRWSNGPTWPEYFAGMIGLSTSDKTVYRNESHAGGWSLCLGDKAMGIQDLTGDIKTVVKNMVNGSLIPPCLELLVKAYLYRHEKFSENDLVVVFFGGNDYLNRFQAPERVIEAQKVIIETAIENGAKHIAWASMPDLSKTPRYYRDAFKPQTEEISRLVQEHNRLLEEEWELLQIDYSEGGVTIALVDTKEIFSDILSNHHLYGLSVTDRPCSTIPAPGLEDPVPNNVHEIVLPRETAVVTTGEVCQNPDEYMFFDSVHPTTAAHKLIATKACEIMRREGYRCSS